MPTIQEAIENYLRDIPLGKSAQTAKTYSQGLRRFTEYLAEKRHSPTRAVSTLTVENAINCARWLNEARGDGKTKIAKTTFRTYLSSISSFFAYLLRERLVEFNAADIQRMKETFKEFRGKAHRPIPKLPPDDAVHALLNAARDVKPNAKKPRLELARLRNIAMLEALRASGMRVGEMVGLKRGDLDYRAQTAIVTGKGAKQRVVYFDDPTWSAIQTYLQARADGASGRALHQLPLFARHDRRASGKILPLTTDGVRLVFNLLARAARIEIAMTPHSLRHAFATKLLDASGDLALVQDMLGHASPTTTRIYAQVSSKRMRDAHRAAFAYADKDKESKN